MLSYLSGIQQSYSVAFADYVRKQEAIGKKIVKMQTGDPDFPTHPNVINCAMSAMKAGATKYSDSRGLPGLRKAIVEKLKTKNSITANADENILVTHGAVHGIGIAVRSIVNAGDECIILQPYWRSYEANVILSGGVPVIVNTKEEKGFQLEADEVIARITPKTKLIIINTPNNPSGAVYNKAELIKLAQDAARRGIYILSDEVYEGLVFSGEHYSIASDSNIADWVISVFSFSKTYAMTGWRIGYVCASKKIIDQILKLSQFSVTSLAPFSQSAAICALEDAEVQSYAEEMRRKYNERLELITDKIKGTWLESVTTIPRGAFYVLINICGFGTNSLDLAKRIVEFAGVSFTPGIAFGDDMDNHLRMCFASSVSDIDAAINALVNYWEY